MSSPDEAPTVYGGAGLPGILGRTEEMAALRTGLERALQGDGASLLVLGPGGMGKTRLLRWLEAEARPLGFQVRWGNGLKEAIAPFFVFQQIFRRRVGAFATDGLAEDAGGASGSGGPPLPEPLPPLLVFEEERPRRFRGALPAVGLEAPLLLISRESPTALRARGPPLSATSQTYWITRMEGEGRLPPGNLDRIGEVAAAHLQAHPGGRVAMDGLEYLTSQSSFPPVLRLLQFVRDVAEETGGHVLIALNPGAFDKREVALVEADAEVLKVRSAPEPSREEPSAGGSGAEGREPPAETLLRYLRTLEEEARMSPQLVVVDDLHWADAPSGTAFQFLARNLRGQRVLLVGGAREEEIPSRAEEEGSSLAERIEGLVQEGSLRRLPLHGFREAEASGLAAELLGAPLAPGQEGALRALLRRTEGNPYFLRETLLQLRDEGGLRPGPSGLEFAAREASHGVLDHVPTTLRRLVLQRLVQVAPEDRAFLNTAAVAGSEFELAPVADARGLGLEEARRTLARLERQHRVIESDPAARGSRWLFSHPLVWEVTVSEMPVPVRRKEASTLLTWWEERRPEALDDLARLGYGTGDLARGGPWVRRALTSALGRLAPEAATTYLQWLQELERAGGRRPSPEEVQEVARLAGRVARSGAPRQMVRFLQELLREPLDEASRWEAEFVLATCTEAYDSAEARRILTHVRQEIDRAGPRVPVRLRHSVVTFHAYLLQQEGATAELEEALRPVLAAPPEEMARDIAVRARVVATMAAIIQGQAEHARQLLTEAEALAQDDVGTLAEVRHARGVLNIRDGNWQAAVLGARDAARLYREAGLLTNALINEYNAAEIIVEHGDVEEAHRIAEEVLALGRKFDLPRIRCSGEFLQAQVAIKRRTFPEAIAWAEASLRSARGLHRFDDERDCRGLLAFAWGESGDLPKAIAELDALTREPRVAGTADEPPLLVDLARYLEQAGQLDRARTVMRRALETSRQMGDQRREGMAREALERMDRPAPGRTPSAGPEHAGT